MDKTRVKTELGGFSPTKVIFMLNVVHQRVIYLQSAPDRDSQMSGYSTPTAHSGYQTPREIKEERWRQEAEPSSKPGKVEMRGMYKELGGRKSKAKTKLGSTGVRDRGGWEGDGGTYDAPW